MKIDVTEILESFGEAMVFQESQHFEGSDEIFQCIRGPVTVKGVATTVDKGQIYLQANAAGKMKLHCARCLTPFLLDFNLNFEARFVKEIEPEDEDEDIEVRLLDGVYCELDDLIASEIKLAVPMKPLCHEECKGLCQVCGTNLNEGSCQCAKTVEGPTLFGAKLLEVLKERSKYNGRSKKTKI